jgi:hypothetical protein
LNAETTLPIGVRKLLVSIQFKIRDAGAVQSRPGDDKVTIENPLTDFITIGRYNSALGKIPKRLDLPENEKTVSRKHCELHPAERADTLLVRDFSTGGTFILQEEKLVLGLKTRFDIGNILFYVKELDTLARRMTLRIENAYIDALKAKYVGREFTIDNLTQNKLIGSDSANHICIPEDPLQRPISAAFEFVMDGVIVRGKE